MPDTYKVRYGLAGRIALCAVDLFNGLYSNYPSCCVWAWVKDTWHDRPQFITRMRQCIETEDDLEFWGWEQRQYIPCPKCFKARNIRTKIRRGAINRYAFLRLERCP